MIIANFMDSSLIDLRRKGVFGTVGDTYNPGRGYERVIHFTPHAQDLGVAKDLADYNVEIRTHNVSAVEPLKFMKALAHLYHAFGRDRVDLVRGRLPYVGSLLGGLAGRLRGLPFVVSLGGDNRIPQEQNGYYYGSRFLSYGIETAVLLLATRIIVPNLFTSRYVAGIIGERAARRRCAVIGWLSPPVPAADEADSEILGSIGLPADCAIVPIIGFVNRYKFSHIIFDMLERGPLTDANGRPALVCFAGDGPLRAEGERRLAGRSDVRFLGWQPKSVVQALQRRAAVVAIPMSGFVLLEAASLGKPVVTSRVEWHGELVEDGNGGVLVDPDDPIAWREAIERLLGHRDLAARMGTVLKSRYEESFSREAMMAAEHRLYEELTGKRVAA